MSACSGRRSTPGPSPLVAFGRSLLKSKRIDLVGWGEAGPWVVLAKALAGDAVTKTAADLNQFRFETVKTTDDPMMLPGAVKYGGLPAFAALCAPGELYLHNAPASAVKEPDWVGSVYRAAGASAERQPDQATPQKVVAWLLR